MMQRFYLFAYLLVAINISIGAQANYSKAYKGLTLDIDLSKLNIDCKDIVYDQTVISQEVKKKPCLITLHFNKLGKQSFQIFDGNQKELASFNYMVEALPPIKARIGEYTSGYISLSELMAYKSINLDYSKTQVPEMVNIVSFQFEHSGEDVKTVKRLNMRNKFNTEISNLLLRVKEKDRINISKIEVTIGDFNPIYIDPISLKVTD